MTAPRALVAIVAAAMLVSAVAARPLRVMSISECTDQLVLALVPPARITSVTWLSRDPESSAMARQAAGVPVNRGTAEEVLQQRPDLVFAGTFTTPATRQLLKRLGSPLIEIGPADTLAAIRAQTRQVAAAVGEPARGEALLARMDRELADLARAPGPRLRIAAWDGSGFSAARGTLYDLIVTLSGAINLAADRHLRTGVPDTELLLSAAPALLLRGGGDDRAGLRADVADSALVRRFWGTRSLSIPASAYVCGTPFVADAAVTLRRQLRGVAATGPAPLPFVAR